MESSAFHRSAKVLIDSIDLSSQNGRVHIYDKTAEFSDGEIYLNVQKYENDTAMQNKWITRLTESKQVCIKQLLSHTEFKKAFDTLLDFPALLIWLELGNIQRMIASKCVEEIIRCIKHIAFCWNHYTLGRPSIRQAVTFDVVSKLQFRAPTASSEDREYISAMLRKGVIFKSLSQRVRDDILKAILELDVIIPSIKYLHENFKYLEIGAKILKKVVVDRNLRDTIESALYKAWKKHHVQTTNCIRIEGPGDWEEVRDLSTDDMWSLTYKVLWVATLRLFPELDITQPRKESKEILPDSLQNSVTQYNLARIASELGIKTSKVGKAIRKDPRRQILETFISKMYQDHPKVLIQQITDQLERTLPSLENLQPTLSQSDLALSVDDGESINRRRGRPYYNSYLRNKSILYLRNLSRRRVSTIKRLPSTLYVQLDFFAAFFGETKLPFSEQPEMYEDELMVETMEQEEHEEEDDPMEINILAPIPSPPVIQQPRASQWLVSDPTPAIDAFVGEPSTSENTSSGEQEEIVPHPAQDVLPEDISFAEQDTFVEEPITSHQRVLIPENARTPIQSIVDPPEDSISTSISDTPLPIVEQNAFVEESVISHQRVPPPENARTPIQSIADHFEDTISTKSPTAQIGIKQVTEPISSTQFVPPEAPTTNYPTATVLEQAKDGTSSSSSRIRTFWIYNGKLEKRSIDLRNLEEVLKMIPNTWTLFGGPTFPTQMALPVNEWENYISQMENWKYTFVIEGYIKEWRREGPVKMSAMASKHRRFGLQVETQRQNNHSSPMGDVYISEAALFEDEEEP